ncbi:hypothetical protein RHECNPAF_2530045 [Rhizobium etli CNPAF512]|nr:hypothetical protein RHECNPAF_2530045 [Rhizobium etli CNPAF512]
MLNFCPDPLKVLGAAAHVARIDAEPFFEPRRKLRRRIIADFERDLRHRQGCGLNEGESAIHPGIAQDLAETCVFGGELTPERRFAHVEGAGRVPQGPIVGRITFNHLPQPVLEPRTLALAQHRAAECEPGDQLHQTGLGNGAGKPRQVAGLAAIVKQCRRFLRQVRGACRERPRGDGDRAHGDIGILEELSWNRKRQGLILLRRLWNVLHRQRSIVGQQGISAGLKTQSLVIRHDDLRSRLHLDQQGARIDETKKAGPPTLADQGPGWNAKDVVQHMVSGSISHWERKGLRAPPYGTPLAASALSGTGISKTA